MPRTAGALFDSLGWSRRPSLLAYGFALAAAALAALTVVAFQTAPVAPFMLAVIVATWFGGTRPGVLALAVAFAAMAVLLDDLQTSRLFYFVIISSFIVWIVASERTSNESLRRASAQLRLQNETLLREKAEGQALQEKLRHSEADLRLAIDTIPIMAWTLRADGTVESLSRRWLEYSGMSANDAPANSMLALHPDDVPRVMAKWTDLLAQRKGYEDEMRLRRFDGEYRRFLVRTVPRLDENGQVVRWYGTSTDIEDLERAKQALRESAERLQHLSRRLLAVQEEERRRLSRELHDEFGQLLATAKLHLHAAKALAGEPARESLDQCAAVLLQAGDQVRTLALELRPALLETAGLDATLRWLARQHEQRTGMSTSVSGEIDDVGGDLAVACFRVAQEALTNIVRHSGARNVWIEMRGDDSRVEISIRDDGAGFDVRSVLHESASRGHLGLVGMRERVDFLGGSLAIESRAGEGTRIRASFPR